MRIIASESLLYVDADRSHENFTIVHIMSQSLHPTLHLVETKLFKSFSRMIIFPDINLIDGSNVEPDANRYPPISVTIAGVSAYLMKFILSSLFSLSALSASTWHTITVLLMLLIRQFHYSEGAYVSMVSMKRVPVVEVGGTRPSAESWVRAERYMWGTCCTLRYTSHISRLDHVIRCCYQLNYLNNCFGSSNNAIAPELLPSGP